jgi:chromosome segregation ATPase
MRIDELPRQFKAFVDQAVEVFDWEVGEVQRRLAASTDKKSAIDAEVADAQTQLKQTQAQLKAANTHLGKASDLLSLNSEIAEARKTLGAVKAEIEKATAAKAAVEKQCADSERKLIAVTNDVSGLTAVRARNEELIREQRAKWCS